MDDIACVTNFEQTLAQATRNLDQNSSAPASARIQQQSFKPCNCRKSRCLKLYCECFANNRFCGPHCACCSCQNSAQFDAVRLQAKQQILMRNPHAFRTSKVVETGSEKVQILASETQSMASRHKMSSQGLGTEAGSEKHHFKGCNCRKTKCLKNYCECF